MNPLPSQAVSLSVGPPRMESGRSSISSRIVLFAVCALAAFSVEVSAQEPAPAGLRSAAVESGERIGLTRAWRYHGGNDVAWSAPAFDDRTWETVQPQMPPASRPRGGWPGEGWFRRHVSADAGLQGQELVLRIEAPGKAWVYLDGVLVLETAPAAGRKAGGWTTVSLRGGAEHLLAVRYACRCGGPGEIGFVLSIEGVAAEDVVAAGIRRDATISAAFTAVPFVLGVLHLALFVWNRKARENLYCALCMFSLAVIIASALAQDILRDRVAVVAIVTALFAGVVGATFFGLLTYATSRIGRVPRSWVFFAVSGVAVIALIPRLGSTAQNVTWSLYFFASLVEIVRIELREEKVKRGGGLPLLVGMLLLDAAIVAQILITFGVIPPPFGFDSVYLGGVLAFSISTSLFVARSFARTSIDLERRLAEVEELSGQVIAAERESARRGLEIEAARTLQRSILPATVPQFPSLELAAAVTTASEVGGDYYDFRAAGDDAVIVALGDAAGHGVAAGAMVTATKALFSSMAGEENLPAILGQCDRVLRGMNVRPLHMCLMLARVTPDSLTVASAAMPRPLRWSAAGGRVDEIDVSGLPLAASLGSDWDEVTVPLASGDVLLFASDGLAEALSPAGEPLGYERVASLFAAAAAGVSAESIIERLLEDAAEWRGTRPQDDDIAIVVVKNK